ncbi:fatty acid desaturase-domain-containing protein [Stachybotrys elegans]|uniref:Delta 8-(E)-sphingolipid desaturase n=1 Tax=Stachybotrys elegans TaxID=80388 RepID=A0A8K0WUC8_9HYPO|nr:fatty acid desaturase-domain-containing protein [Stachybotrys elegans]
MAPASPKAKAYPLMSRGDIEALIASGRKLIIVDQYVLKVDPFVSYHPGGEKAIEHMIGRDATDEVTVLHSPEAKEMMLRYRVGKIEGRWTNFLPPIQGGVFRTAEQIAERTDDSDSDKDVNSSTSASREPSPLFDETHDQGARQRRTAAGSTQSVSSESAAEEEMDGMSYLDSITREHIKLDLDMYPDVDLATQDHIIAKYRELHDKIKAAGLYECNYWAYAVECCRYVACFVTSMTCLYFGRYFLSAVALGCLWHQLVFTAHDAGHMGITHNFQIDSILGIFIANFMGGLSMGWWKRSHNIHHIVTNAPEHDPDIEHLPFFAISHRLLGNLRSTYYDRVMKYDAMAKFMMRIQAWTYYPILSLARFNLTFLSMDYIIAHRGPRKGPAAWHWWLEIAGIVFFWTWYGYGILYRTIPDNWSRFVFLFITNFVPSPLHLQIVLSHFAMSTADLGPNESFPQKMLRTTMDIDCPEWLDFIHGGLQFQAIHHLYPRIPRHNLRATRKLVQQFCDEVGIPYALYGFTNSNKKVLGTLSEVSRQAAILAKCQRTIVKEGVGRHH